ncbi:MAG: hypothetical protein ACLFNW_08120 [Desulfobacterales bacterium]
MRNAENSLDPFLLPEEEYRWLDGAINLDACHHSRIDEFHALTDEVYSKITNGTVINNKYRSKQTLKTILLNLWVGYLCGNPVMYSRNANNYSHARRYGKLHFKYKRVLKIMDTMYALGYMDQRIGYFNREDGVKRRTRIYAAEPLKELFEKYLPLGFNVVEREKPREIIQLRGEDKVEIDYPETKEITKQRMFLHHYNQFVEHQDLKVDIPGDIPIKADFLRQLKLYLSEGFITLEYMRSELNSLIENIQLIRQDQMIEKAGREIEIEIFNNSEVTVLPIPNNNSNISIVNYYNKYLKDIYRYIYTITNNFLINKYSFIDQSDNKERIVLRDLGVSRMVLGINYSSLHRVYNLGSFDLGGRFYGAFHLRMPSELRQLTYINGNNMAEADYKALHIRMLYHMEQIDYRGDPYEAICKNPEDRSFFKRLQLIAINAPTETKVLKGIRHEIWKNDLNYKSKNNDLYPLLERFKQAHKPIAKYLATGIGRTLQNMDSAITESILMTLKKKGIPALPVHDSYVVEEKHKGLLAEVMNETYEKFMGYQPVIEFK